ncbi:MAG: hypothetical protein NWQ13_06955 [Glaciimonas sp.]|nr:hypothetical protein [Glaciimonas sp.]
MKKSFSIKQALQIFQSSDAVSPKFNLSSTFTEEILSTNPTRIRFTLSATSNKKPDELPNILNGWLDVYCFFLSGSQDGMAWEGENYTVSSDSEYSWLLKPSPHSKGEDLSYQYTSQDGNHFQMQVQFEIEMQPDIVYDPNDIYIGSITFSKSQQAGTNFIDRFLPA